MARNFVLRFLLILLLFSQTFSQRDVSLNSHPQSPYDFNQSQAKNIHQIIDGTFELFQFLRNDVGVYADAARFQGPQFHPCSIASVGMGLVSLCIADTLGLIDNAEALAQQTLQAMSGQIAGFKPARNPVNGFFRHWIDLKTGARAWTSEYSSIDTGILVSGALFCKKYFSDNADIARLVDRLYLSIDWSSAISNADRGELYMTFDEQGRGGLKTLPFNEYMIVAWLAKHDPRDNVRAGVLWDKHYENAAALPTSVYKDIALLTDSPGNFLSNFVIQFPYYLCHFFTINPDYLGFLKNAMLADRLWWADETTAPSYVWGTGAGASGFSGSGYNADNFKYNPGKVCSPHIIAGFSPVDSTIAADIDNLWTNDIGVYTVPGGTKKFLWRFSVNQPDWRADDVQGVDISTLIFGLAAHPSVLGAGFFQTFNNFDFPDLSAVSDNGSNRPSDADLNLRIYPNPFNTKTVIRYQLAAPSGVDISVFNVFGQKVAHHEVPAQGRGEHFFSFDASGLSSGLYLVQIRSSYSIEHDKIVLTR